MVHDPEPSRFNEAGSVRSRKPAHLLADGGAFGGRFNEAGSVRSRKHMTETPFTTPRILLPLQ